MRPIARRIWQSVPAGILIPAFALGVARAQPVGDVNCDGTVNSADLDALVAATYDTTQDVCGNADVNGDGLVGAADIVALVRIVDAPPPTPVPDGPVVTFFGLAGPDGLALVPLGEINGAPVFFRNSGSGFKIVVEGAVGASGAPLGTATLNSSPTSPAQLPDLLIESSNPLGDASDKAICDGGVPAVNPISFGSTQAVANALNDFACHFAVGTSPNSACTQDSFGDAAFLNTDTQAQFCLQVSGTLAFPSGDSTLSVRLRDVAGNLGPMQQMILRVATGPVPPTFTPLPTSTPFTPRPTRTPTSVPPSFTVSPSLTPTPRLIPKTPTSSPTRFSTTATATPSRTRTPARTLTASPSATPTPASPIGPVITFFGLTLGDDTLVPPPTAGPGGVPVYQRNSNNQFSLVVEAAPGPSGVAVGRSAYQADLTSLPDLQVEVSQQLGNGSLAVCDRTGAMAGGVPRIAPLSFAPTTKVIDAVNDLGCRFLNGNGSPVGRAMNEACTKIPPTDDYAFVSPDSTVQFCAFIDSVLFFQPGDTVVTARVVDQDGNPGPPSQIVVHIGP